MGLIRGRQLEERAVSYQDVWGSGGDPTTTQYGIADAFKLSAVIACVQLRANLIGQLPYGSYLPGEGGSPVEVKVQPEFVTAPSKMPRSFWLRQMSVSRDIWGNAFGAVAARDAAGYPKLVEWLSPALTTAREPWLMGPLEVTYNGVPFPVEDLIVVPGFPVPGSQLGISPLERSGLIELSHRAQEFGRDWFRNGAVPSTWVESAKPIDASQAERIRESIMRSWRNRKPAVLGSDLTVKANEVKADESQFLDTMRHVQVDICQVFSVPPEEIGVASAGSSITYANREQKAQQILVNGINSDLVLIQEVFTANIPRPQYVRFSTGALLRSDLKTRYESYAIALGQKPFLGVDEVRSLEERPPMPPGSDDPPAPTEAPDA